MTNMDLTSKHIVILGGGPCGLYAGRVLSRSGYKVTILDAGDKPGGLATSHRFGNNWYDMGVHMLHAFDKEIFEDIKGLMGSERIEVQLDARIKWMNQHFRYPLQFQDMIKGIPLLKLAYQVSGLFYAQIKNSLFPAKSKNAEEALIQLYGKPLYKFFFEEFTHKYWGVHPKNLSATFIKTKMPKLSAVDVIKRWLKKLGIKDRGQSTESALTEETLHYSRSGAETMTRCLARSITEAGSKVIQNARVSSVVTNENVVTKVLYEHEGCLQEIHCDACISTIPLNYLIHILQNKPPESVLKSANYLKYKPIVVYGLLVKRQRCLDALYIYYRSRIFHRIGEPKNAGLIVDPPDHTVLIVEMTCEEGDPKWNGEQSVKEILFEQLSEEKICDKSDIVELHLSHYKNGYPIFHFGFEEHLDTVKQHIKQFKNLQTTGRQGAFTYPNMHSAMRMGYVAAENFIKQSQ